MHEGTTSQPAGNPPAYEMLVWPARCRFWPSHGGNCTRSRFRFPVYRDIGGRFRSVALYDSAFPSTEREPRSVILETLRRGGGVVVRVRQNRNTVGLALAHMLRHPPVLFIVYLAVAAELRSRHIGAALFEKLWKEGRRRYSDEGLQAEGMVWEVDIPERTASEQSLQQSRRRIAFFERMGGHLLPGAYFQPPVDGIHPVPMHLMFRPAPGSSLPDVAAHSALVRAIYFEKYHAANEIPEAVLQDLLNKIQGEDVV